MLSGEVASLGLVTDGTGFVFDHLWGFVIVLVGLGLLVLSCRIRRRSTTTDPLRDFASHEYKAGMARAKSARFPPTATAVLIAWRRRRYFPAEQRRLLAGQAIRRTLGGFACRGLR